MSNWIGEASTFKRLVLDTPLEVRQLLSKFVWGEEDWKIKVDTNLEIDDEWHCKLATMAEFAGCELWPAWEFKSSRAHSMRLGVDGLYYDKIAEDFIIEWQTKDVVAVEWGEDPYQRKQVYLNWYEVGQVPYERRLHIKEWNQCNYYKGIPREGVSQDYIYPRICEDDPTMFRVPLWWYDEMEIHQRNCWTVLNMREITGNLTWKSSKRKWGDAADSVI